MNTIFIKEIDSSVIGKKIVSFSINNIGKTSNVLEININNKKAEEILSYIKNVENTSFKINNMFSNLSRSILTKRFEHQLKKIVIKNNLSGYSVIFSNSLKKSKILKEYIKKILNAFSIQEYVYTSTMELNFEKYIDEFKEKNNLKNERIIPLIIVNDLITLDFDIINKLNGKYKELGILCISKINNGFLNRIKNINDDYGSCIQILNSNVKDVRQYNICIFIDISREKCLKYKFNKKTCYIDFTNKENDKFNNNYINLKEKIKEGEYYLDKIKQLYNLYGKVTVSSAIVN